MLRVRYNGELSSLDFSRCSHLSEVVEVCTREATGDLEPRIVTRVRLGDRDLEDQELEQLGSFSLDSVEEVEFETVDGSTLRGWFLQITPVLATNSCRNH